MKIKVNRTSNLQSSFLATLIIFISSISFAQTSFPKEILRCQVISCEDLSRPKKMGEDLCKIQSQFEWKLTQLEGQPQENGYYRMELNYGDIFEWGEDFTEKYWVLKNDSAKGETLSGSHGEGDDHRNNFFFLKGDESQLVQHYMSGVSYIIFNLSCY